jgi:5-hydroxyisourate hydrolase-like protein (transthyretin family)
MEVVIMGRRLQDVKEVFTSLIEQANKMGLEINEKKTKFMTVLRKPYNENENVKIGTYNFEIVEDYTYLGTVLTNKNELRPEIEKRITNANRAHYALLPLLKSQSVCRAEKVKIYKTLIRPVVTYGAEA